MRHSEEKVTKRQRKAEGVDVESEDEGDHMLIRDQLTYIRFHGSQQQYVFQQCSDKDNCQKYSIYFFAYFT